MSDVRLVASDLDGTLIDPTGAISEFTRSTLRAVEASGVHLVFVTGRPPRWMAPVVAETGHAGVAICANGAVVYDLHTERIESVHALDADTALEAARRLRELMPEVAFAVERVDADRRSLVEFGREPHYIPRWPTPDRPPLAPIEELVAGGGIIKLLARVPVTDGQARTDASRSGFTGSDSVGRGTIGPDPTSPRTDTPPVDALLTQALAALNGLATVTHSNPNDTLLEVSAAGITKATALEHLSAQHGVVAAQVVAFGDQLNDLPMLQWAGRAIAVANAHPAVLAAVSEHTESVHDDGVAHALHRILDL